MASTFARSRSVVSVKATGRDQSVCTSLIGGSAAIEIVRL